MARKPAETPEKKAVRKKNKSRMSRAELRSECKRIKAERKVLRKKLRSQGIKKRADFENFAREVGLVYPEESNRRMLIGWYMGAHGLWKAISLTMGIYGFLVGAIALLGLTLLIAYITEERGHFTINMTADMMREGFVLSETEDFSNDTTKLFSKEIVNANATSIDMINRGVFEKDGVNNGPGYMAYTFYLKNAGEMVTDYGYTMNITSETMGVLDATWVMFFEDEHQIVYANVSADGNPEELYGYREGPFIEQAYDPEAQYYTESGRAGIVTTPFIDRNTVLQGYVQNLEPGEVKKYTVIVWVEGDDPECTNAILGGHVGFNIQFERLGEDITGFFKGLYREEYKRSQAGEIEISEN